MVKLWGICSYKCMPDDYEGLLWKKNESERICQTLPGKPLLLEHNKESIIGKVITASLSESGFVRVLVDVDERTPLGRDTISKIRNKEYVGFSCGTTANQYQKDKYKIGVKDKEVFEVSVVKTPNIKTALIEFWESSNPQLDLVSRPKENLLVYEINKKKEDQKSANTMQSNFENAKYKLVNNKQSTQNQDLSVLFQKKAMSQAQGQAAPQTGQQPPVQNAQVNTPVAAPQQTPPTSGGIPHNEIFNNGEKIPPTTSKPIDPKEQLQWMIEHGIIDPQEIIAAETKKRQEAELKMEESRQELLKIFEKVAQDRGTKPEDFDFYNNIKQRPLSELNPQDVVMVSAVASKDMQGRLSDQELTIQNLNAQLEEYKKRDMELQRNYRISSAVNNLFQPNVTQLASTASSIPIKTTSTSLSSLLSTPPSQRTSQQTAQIQQLQHQQQQIQNTNSIPITSVASANANSEPAPQQIDPVEARMYGVPPPRDYLKRKHGDFLATMTMGTYSVNENSFEPFVKAKKNMSFY